MTSSAKSTQTDKSLDSTSRAAQLAKLALFSAGHPVRQDQFPPVYVERARPAAPSSSYVVARCAQVRLMIVQFHALTQKGRRRPRRRPPKKKRSRPPAATPASPRPGSPAPRGREGSRGTDRGQPPSGFPFFTSPSRLTPNGRYAKHGQRPRTTTDPTPRVPRSRDRARPRPTKPTGSSSWRTSRKAATTVFRARTGKSAAAAGQPDVDGDRARRRLQLFKSGNRLRYVAWKRKNAALLGLELADPRNLIQRADAPHRPAPSPTSARWKGAARATSAPRLAWGMW